jgi:hypothetical protein
MRTLAATACACLVPSELFEREELDVSGPPGAAIADDELRAARASHADDAATCSV